MLDTIRRFEKKILKELTSDYKRYLFDKIDFDSQMIGIVGARGVGKTTLLLQYAKKLKEEYPSYKSLYFSYDFPASIDIGLFGLADKFSKIGGEYLLIDEIHKYKDFIQDLKAVYDFFPSLKVIFTGSCATSIYNSQADLSRRVVLYKMQGLSYREFLELKLNESFKSYTLKEILDNSIDIVDEIEKKIIPLEFFNEYLECGYYPFYFKDKNNYLTLLNAVINQTIEIDLVNLSLIKPAFVNKLKKLLLILAESNPFELNITKIASNLEVSRNTIYAYLNHLDKADLINIVLNAKKGISKLSKPEKLYLNNTNLFYALNSDINIGTIRESFFVSQLKLEHTIETSNQGDFLVDGRYIFEVGGAKKSFRQIKDIKNSYLAIDTDNTQNQNKIPLWLFGFLY